MQVRSRTPRGRASDGVRVTDLEALTEARSAVAQECAELDRRTRSGGNGWDPRPRLAHLRDVGEALDRMIRERHEAYT